MTDQREKRAPKSNGSDGLANSLLALKLNGPTSWESEEKLIIALDFGTTFSGIAYCFANQREAKVVAIVDWPGERHFSETQANNVKS
jgi:hypothetical protein